MASTMMATLMVMTVWMRGVTAGGGEASCNINNIPTITDFDFAQLAGSWFLTHRSHTPPHVESLARFTVWPLQGDRARFNYTLVSKDGECRVISADFVVDPNNPGKLSATIIDNIVLNVYFLGADYFTTAAAYEEVVINGVVDPDLGVVDIGVRDPTQLPNMEVLSRGLEMFCGEKATSLDYFDYFPHSSLLACNP